MSKTKILTVRVEEKLYKKLQEDSKNEGVAQYVRELIYDFYYSRVELEELNKIIIFRGTKTSDYLKEVEERKEKIEDSIGKTRENLKKLEALNNRFKDSLEELNRMVREGIEEIT